MKSSETVAKLYSDMVKVQAEMVDVGKGASGYGYNYTSYDDLVKYLRPLLAKHNIGFIQGPTDRGLETRLIHTSGEWIEASMGSDDATLKGMNLYQAIGSKITYYRRYMLSSMVGIASEEDTDTQSKSKSPTSSSKGSW